MCSALSLSAWVQRFLTERLRKHYLLDKPAVSRGDAGNCLFLCFLHELSNQCNARNYDPVAKTILLPVCAEKRKSELREEGYVAATLEGLRRIAVQSAARMIEQGDKGATVQLLRHMVKRFGNPVQKQQDDAVHGYTAPASTADRTEVVRAWGQLMMGTGAEFSI